MAIGPIVKSVLKATIKELPEDYARKSGSSTTAELLKKGVKKEELDQSGIVIPKSNVTKQSLVDAEAKREDKFFTTEPYETNYDLVTLGKNASNPTYREKVVEFQRKSEVGKQPLDENQSPTMGVSRTHFPDQEDYVMHTRIYDETLNNKPTRVLTEIQSDVFQEGEGKGLPFEKTWLRKGIERELVDGINEGREQLAIPISGKVGELMRSTGVQKWYETSVLNTAKKVAKSTNSDFSIEKVFNQGEQMSLSTRLGQLNEANRIQEADDLLKDYNINISMEDLSTGEASDAVYEMLDETIISTERTAELSSVIDDLVIAGKADEANTLLKEYNIDVTFDELQSSSQQISMRAIDAVRAMRKIEVPVDDSVSYAVIKPRSKDFSTSLYTSPVAGAFVAYQAYQTGMAQEDVEKKLSEKYDYDEEDIAEVRKRVDLITKSKEAGMSIEEIKTKMEGRETVATTRSSEPAEPKKYSSGVAGMAEAMRDSGVTDIKGDARRNMNGKVTTPKQQNYEKLINATTEMSAEEFVSSYKVIHPTMVSDTLTTIPAWFGNKEAVQRYDVARTSARKYMIDKVKEKYGLDLKWAPEGVATEDFYLDTDEGFKKVTPGVWEDVKKLSGEVTGGVAGMIAGARTGAALSPPTPWTKAAGTLIGGAIGSIGGAVGGSQADYLYQAIKLQEDVEAEAMAYRALNAFEAAAIGETIGYPIVKGLGTGWNGIVKAKNFIANGEARSAFKSIKETTFLNDDQIADIVTQLEKHATLKGNAQEKGIQAVALTEPGMQSLVKAASGTNPRAGGATAYTVTSRAEDVLKQTARLTDEQVPRMLAKDLKNYTIDVKDQYARVKALATQSPKGLNFQWNMEDLAIQPVMDDLLTKLVDPTVRDKFIQQMRRVNGLSESHKYGDLLELRQMTNDFLFNNKIAKADDKDSIRKVIGNIDRAIEEGAESVLENPKQWLKDWSKARTDYSQMKQIERTAMYRSMYDQNGKLRSLEPKQVVESLGKYITSIDGSFESLMSKLPIAGRKMYEGAVVDVLTKQFTAGIEQGSRTIHFPMLADELRKISFTTPDARATKNALIELGETFKNDVFLTQGKGEITIPKFQSYLTIDPVVRAQYEAASGIFNYIKSKGPGAANRQLALVRATSKLIEKPLDAHNFKFLQDQVFDDSNLSKQILDLTQEAARREANEIDVTPSRVKIYAGGKLKGTNQIDSIPQHRILTLAQAKEIAETEAITLDSKSLDAILIKHGYKAILESSDRVRILGDK